MERKIEVGAEVVLMDPDEAPAGEPDGVVLAVEGERYLVEFWDYDGEEVMPGGLKLVRWVQKRKWFPAEEVRLFEPSSE